MPANEPTNGDGDQQSANDEFMDSWAVDGEDDYDEEEPRRTPPGLVPGMLLGAGLAAICAVGIYLVAGGGSDSGTSPQTITYTQNASTVTVTHTSSVDPIQSTAVETVTEPRKTVTVKVQQPNGPASTLTQTVTKTERAPAPPPATKTVTQTKTETRTVGPTLP